MMQEVIKIAIGQQMHLAKLALEKNQEQNCFAFLFLAEFYKDMLEA